MKDFSKRRFRIADSATEVKVAYTGFLTFTFIGYLTISLMGLLRVGPTYQDIVTHYRGSEIEEAAFPRSFGQMLEEAHFHAFIEGLILLTLTHIFVATSVSRPMKFTVILIAFGSTLTDLASPWLIKYVSGGFAFLQMTSWIAMVASALILIAVPLYEMWIVGAKRRRK
jgi:hypothetical protein